MQSYQKPYPPLWYASNNMDTVPWIARHGFNTCNIFSPNAAVKPHLDLYKQVWEEHLQDTGRLNGHVQHPKLGLARHLYVAPTVSQAVSEARSAYDVWFSNINCLWEQAGDNHLENLRGFDDLLANGVVIAGSPQSVREQLKETVAESGINYFCPIFAFGDLSHQQVMRSMELFVREVMPHLR